MGLKLLGWTDLTISVEPPWEVMSPSIQSPRSELLLRIPDSISVNWKESFVLGQTTHSTEQFAKARFVSDGGSIEGKSLFVGSWNRAEVKRWLRQMSILCIAVSNSLAVWPVVGDERRFWMDAWWWIWGCMCYLWPLKRYLKSHSVFLHIWSILPKKDNHLLDQAFLPEAALESVFSCVFFCS